MDEALDVAVPQSNGNGASADSPRERIALDLEREIGQLKLRRDELASELSGVTSDIKAFEQSLLRLRGEPLINHPGAKRGPYKKASPAQTKSNGHPKGISNEGVETIAAEIRAFVAERDVDEFRQVDIRGRLAGNLGNSSTMAVAFERLRQDGVVRFARKEGNNKFFRLTAEALRELESA